MGGKNTMIILPTVFLPVVYLCADIFLLSNLVSSYTQLTLRYFILSFVVMTALICWRFIAVSGSNDERKKGKVLIKGMAGHFAGSLAIILVYHYLFHDGNSVLPVWTAMALYVVSLVVVTATAVRG